jgi:hypothetical protein
MTSQVPESQHHVNELLPEYVNRKLDPLIADRVREHLLHCETCQAELSTWEALRETALCAVASEPLPSLNILDQVWAKIDAPIQEAQVNRWPIRRVIVHLWLVLNRQVRIIHKSIWIASTLVGLFCCCLALYVSTQSHNHVHDATSILTLFTAVVAASGVAFIYGKDNDEGFEITLSTPTSIRIVMLCRMVLVIGYNFVLSALASVIIAVAHGGGLWEIIQLWLGPMLLLSSISVSLTLMVGSAFALAISLLIEALQAIPITIEKGFIALQVARPDMWQTSPYVVLVAVLLLALAVFYAPRQPRLSN